MSIQKVIGRDIGLWRYMDLSKLLDILVNKHLTFPRFDRFEDPYEGYSSNYMDLVKKAYYEKASPSSMPFYPHMEIGIINNQIRLINLHSYISCWHMNESESAAMWKLYCNSSDSVAIKTSVGKLRYALSEYCNEISDGGVSYDSTYRTQEKLTLLNLVDPLFTKRESFEHEKEFRMIFHDYSSYNSRSKKMDKDFEDYHAQKKNQGEYNLISKEMQEALEKGIYFDVNNNMTSKDYFLDQIGKEMPLVKQLIVDPVDFIEEIIISPDSPDWFFETVKLTVEKLGYDLPIRKSKLYELN